MMFWRQARDDFAWPSLDDLLLKQSHLEAEIKKKETELSKLTQRFQSDRMGDLEEDYLLEMYELESELRDLTRDLNSTRVAIERFEEQPDSQDVSP